MIRWWDRWLKDEDNGIDREPPIVLFAQRSTRPGRDAPGDARRVAVRAPWPAERLRPTTLALADAATAPPAGHAGDVLEVRGDVGWTRGSLRGPACRGDSPTTNARTRRSRSPTRGRPSSRARDPGARALSYAHVVGTDRVSVAKLCDVFPDGASSLVSRTC